MNFLRKTQKVLVQTAQKRNLHVHYWADTKGAIHAFHKSKKEAYFWCAVLGVAMFIYFPLTKPKFEAYVEPDMAKRNKEKPLGWVCVDCGMLEVDCQVKCLKEQREKKALYEKHKSKFD
eukprot:gene11011-3717_t